MDPTAHVLPPLVVRAKTPNRPTATHVLGFAQLIENSVVPAPEFSVIQLAPPLLVTRTSPSSPTAKQVVGDGQLIPNNAFPVGAGFCQYQVPPTARVGEEGGCGGAVVVKALTALSGLL